MTFDTVIIILVLIILWVLTSPPFLPPSSPPSLLGLYTDKCLLWVKNFSSGWGDKVTGASFDLHVGLAGDDSPDDGGLAGDAGAWDTWLWGMVGLTGVTFPVSRVVAWCVLIKLLWRIRARPGPGLVSYCHDSFVFMSRLFHAFYNLRKIWASPPPRSAK